MTNNVTSCFCSSFSLYFLIVQYMALCESIVHWNWAIPLGNASRIKITFISIFVLHVDTLLSKRNICIHYVLSCPKPLFVHLGVGGWRGDLISVVVEYSLYTVHGLHHFLTLKKASTFRGCNKSATLSGCYSVFISHLKRWHKSATWRDCNEISHLDRL